VDLHAVPIVFDSGGREVLWEKNEEIQPYPSLAHAKSQQNQRKENVTYVVSLILILGGGGGAIESFLWFTFMHVRLSIEERKRRCILGFGSRCLNHKQIEK
jgi:hypothetical protein